MRKRYAYNSVIIWVLILAVVMMLSFAGCDNSDLPEDTTSNNETEDITESGTENNTENGETVLYELPTGAESEYALYSAVVDYLNNGFHSDDLQDVFDRNLTIAFYSKCAREPEYILTLGMKYDEASELVARLRAKAENMDFLVDDGVIDMDYIDHDAFISEFPEAIQSQLRSEDLEDTAYPSFIRFILYYDDLLADGENPFGTDQTVWEKISEAEFEAYEYDDYKDWDKDMFLNFPRLYRIDLGTHIFGSSAYSMSMLYAEIDGRYYFIDFSCVLSGLGG